MTTTTTMTTKHRAVALALFVAVTAAAAAVVSAQDAATTKPAATQAAAAAAAVAGDRRTTPSGLTIISVQPGEGAQPGDTVFVHYTGKLQDGKVFDSSVDKGDPISFVLGQGQVIKGWDEGIQGMQIGEKRQLIIPPALGYGEQGAGTVIPKNATLTFDVELVGAVRMPPRGQ